jgi:DNA-binding MarR family transcriptional regulator/GNAT superfamily N-acetyltransferase
MAADGLDVSAVRAFNRFWTNEIGALQAGLLETQFSLTEARILFELAQQETIEASELRRRLRIDSGYLSRILGRLESGELLTTTPSPIDRRRRTISLTRKGKAAFRDLDARSAAQARTLLTPLKESDRRRVIGAMRAIQETLGEGAAPLAYVLRPPHAGDFGRVVEMHGRLYADEYGWDSSFEALVARIVADYAEGHDPRRECAWMAEIDGEPVGCVFCTKKDEDSAQLRLLLVAPSARGLGIGRRLVEECIQFARAAGYVRIVLWTNDVLTAARRLYERAGFRLVTQDPHRSFGHELTGQIWELDLRET